METDFVAGGDQVQDKKNAIDFGKEAGAKNSVQISKSNPNKATIIVGEEEWPLPVPLVKKNGKWYFDAKAGEQEILFRRIGANELDAITVCRGYVDAQKEYALGATTIGVNQYAQKIISTPGSKMVCTGRTKTAPPADRSVKKSRKPLRKATTTATSSRAAFTATTSRS